jgi:hypothetical protein
MHLQHCVEQHEATNHVSLKFAHAWNENANQGNMIDLLEASLCF